MSAEKAAVVVDTNVAVVANRNTEQAGQDCVSACIDTLRQIIQDEKYIILLDDGSLIFDEYLKNLSLSGQPGFGDFFIKWLWESQTDERYCRTVPVTAHDERGFEEFPDDPDLASFDWDDRKFVAVAVASKSGPRVLNASDTDWRDYREPLRRNGVEVDFLCPELMCTAP